MLISAYMVIDASVHDSYEIETLIDDDASYICQENSIEQCGITNKVHEKWHKHY